MTISEEDLDKMTEWCKDLCKKFPPLPRFIFSKSGYPIGEMIFLYGQGKSNLPRSEIVMTILKEKNNIRVK